MMMERGGHLNQSLKKGFLRTLGVQPDLLPGLVGLEEMARVKESHSVREEIRGARIRRRSLFTR